MPKPGDIFLSKISGIGGRLVWLGQAFNGDTSPWTHAGIVLDDGTIFESRAGGARIASLPTGEDVRHFSPPLTDEQRAAIVTEARKHVGIGYNWTTYFYLAAYRLRLPWITGVLRSRVADDTRLICSQAVDHIYLLAGVHLFDDGRLPYDVTPGDLSRLADELARVHASTTSE